VLDPSLEREARAPPETWAVLGGPPDREGTLQLAACGFAWWALSEALLWTHRGPTPVGYLLQRSDVESRPQSACRSASGTRQKFSIPASLTNCSRSASDATTRSSYIASEKICLPRSTVDDGDTFGVIAFLNHYEEGADHGAHHHA
jgi:hypothetical protein